MSCIFVVINTKEPIAQVSVPDPMGTVLSPEPTLVITETVFTSTPTFAPTATLPLPDPTLQVTGCIGGTGDNNNYNGYCWHGYWIPGLVTFDTQFLRMPPVVMGSAVMYAPYLMQANIAYRGLPTEGTIGGVALPFCSEIGHWVWLKAPGLEWEGPFVVADCSRRNDMYGHVMVNDQVVEVDFETALRWRMARTTTLNEEGWMPLMGKLDGVLVSKVPPQLFNGVIIDLSVWFPKHVTFALATENRDQIENYIPPGFYGGCFRCLGVSNPSQLLPMWLINGEWITFP
jgi:hypothetical protein